MDWTVVQLYRSYGPWIVRPLAAVNCTLCHIDTTPALRHRPRLTLHVVRLWKIDYRDCISFTDKLQLPGKKIDPTFLELCSVVHAF